MKEPLVDHRGNTIEAGVKVAYNLSGEIAIGTVVSATPAIKDGWSYIKRAMIKVSIEYPVGQAGNISSVRNPKNVMVIYE